MLSNRTTGNLKSFSARMCLVFLFCGMVLQTQAQTREDLERDKQNIEREINLINQMIQETKRTANVSLNHLVMINRQINSRENLLRNMRNEINLINRRIDSYNDNIKALKEELKMLRASYAKMIQHANKNRDATRRIMFIVSSDNFNQALLRMKYLQQYARHRQLQAIKIEETSKDLAARIVELHEARYEQQALLDRQQQEVATLTQEKTVQNQTVTQLRRKERELLQRLRDQEKAAQALQRSIERVIAEERRKAQDQAKADGRVVTDMFALTPEERILSDNFAENYGSLLWPVERGIITSPFGEQPHPVLRGIRINNNGVDIATTEGTKARAIFDGVVSRVISIPGGSYAVIVRHGEYLTVYSNIEEVLVKNGDKIRIRQELGTIATDTRDSKTQMNLQIWKGNDKLNPQLWIARQR